MDGGCWMSPSACLGAVLKIKVATPSRNGIPVIYPMTTQAIYALHFPTPALY